MGKHSLHKANMEVEEDLKLSNMIEVIMTETTEIETEILIGIETETLIGIGIEIETIIEIEIEIMKEDLENTLMGLMKGDIRKKLR